ncbi:MAG: 5-formyltetrahydrofolate cyclo-ligase [Clostridiales bacterium]|nr:5-formyltetrahydrofolate cyclo-ligase [Clostridiales bacterium]
MNIRDVKKQLRRELMKREGDLPAEYVSDSNDGIFKNLLSLPEFQTAERVMLFYSIWNEPDTVRLINHSLECGKTVALPESLPRGVMKARVIKSLDELVPAVFNIPAPTSDMPELLPEKLDFVLVPSVAYDREGYRLGHGGGYYDRFLPRTGAFKCGVARERMLVDRAPRGRYDVAVDCLVTEDAVLRFVHPEI